MQRRDFLWGAGAMAGGVALGGEVAVKRLKLGYDNFAVRAMGWKDRELIDYAVKLKVDTVFITDLDAFRSLEAGDLGEVRKYAEDRGIEVYLGTWSVCPTSVSFKKKWGTAEEHLRLGLRSAKALGSPVLRVVLGKGEDRLTDGGIEARIEDTVKELKRVKEECEDLGVKVAMENHAGDMHSTELVTLVEEAGSDFVGVNLDAGNAVWTLETPMSNLEALGKYVLTTSLRDTNLWDSENGVTMQWMAMGEGMVDWEAYFKRFAALCPKAPVQIETISGFNRELALDKEDFWKSWPKGKPKSLEGFVKWAEGGKAMKPRKSATAEEEKTFQLGEIERSIRYCQSIGLGLKG